MTSAHHLTNIVATTKGWVGTSDHQTAHSARWCRADCVLERCVHAQREGIACIGAIERDQSNVIIGDLDLNIRVGRVPGTHNVGFGHRRAPMNMPLSAS